MESISHIALHFSSVGLKDKEAPLHKDRIDTKFVFHIDKLPAFLLQAKDHYSILQINSSRIGKYETLYFDTLNFDFYLNHHNAKANRYKVRFRKYADSGDKFLEIKFKSNKNRTFKERMEYHTEEVAIDGEYKQFIEERVNIDAGMLLPVMWTNCSRMTLMTKEPNERITLDFDLNLKTDFAEKHLANLVIAEIKHDSNHLDSPFFKLMKQAAIRETSFSKYCMGVSYLYSGIKKNNFKSHLLLLNKLHLD